MKRAGDPEPDAEADAKPAAELVARGPGDRGELAPEPPVVARMIIEIRSDGSRTIARGALEDVATGQRAAIEAQGGTPIQLAFALARSLGQLPRFALKSVFRRRLKP